MSDRYEYLLEHITEPGRYVINTEVLPEQKFPGDAPIFVVQCSGLGHDDAGQEMLVGLIIMFLAPFFGAWILANTSGRILSRYVSRLFFFTGIGIVMSLFGIMGRFSIENYPLSKTLVLTIHDLVVWIIAGLVIVWLIRPVSTGNVMKTE